jgi:undecaprenyl-diphosphatase
LSRLGSHGAVWLALALVLSLAWRRARPFLLVIIADAASDGAAGIVKALGHERRPNLPHPLIAVPHSHAFPSGHAATSFACATVLAALVPRGAAAFYALALAIAYSRVYVGVHWPLDVVGGAVLGVLTALLLLAATRRRSARSRRSG